MEAKTLENLRVYQKAQAISELAWEIVQLLPKKEEHPTGNQFIRSADSISANVSEGYGRKTPKDRAHFFVIARGSLLETKNWRSLLQARYAIPDETNEKLEKLLNEEHYLINRFLQYLNSQTKNQRAKGEVKSQ